MYRDCVSGTHGAENELDLLLHFRARPGVGLSRSGPWRIKGSRRKLSIAEVEIPGPGF